MTDNGRQHVLCDAACGGVIVIGDGDKLKARRSIDYKPRKGGPGFGLSSANVMYTLNTIDQHIVARVML